MGPHIVHCFSLSASLLHWHFFLGSGGKERLSWWACSLLNRIPCVVAQPGPEPGQQAEHCSRTECLSGRAMVTIWEQAVTYVDHGLPYPNGWLGSKPLGLRKGQCVPILPGCGMRKAAILSTVIPFIFESSKKRQLPGTSSAHGASSTANPEV